MKRILIFACLLGSSYVANAQIGIGTPEPTDSAILEISSTDKGVLIPRIALTDLTNYQLFKATTEAVSPEVVGMLIFNTTVNETKGLKAGFHYWDGQKWQLITSEKEITSIVTNIKEEVRTEIEKITEVIIERPGGEGNLTGYMVVFDPETEKLFYLKPNEDGSYSPGEVTFAELVRGSETITHIKAIYDSEEPTKVIGYEYFNEKVVDDWLKANPTKTSADIPSGQNLGFKIDVLEAITQNFEKIIESNTEKITEVIKEADGTVRVVIVEGKPVLQYKPVGSEEYVNVDLSGVETVTTIDKYVYNATTTAFEAKTNTTVPEGKKGVIYYAYQGEKDAAGNATTHYIDLSDDIANVIIQNDEVQNSFTSVVNNILNGEGGNVYFGMTGTETKPVLYVKDDEGTETKIDISASVKEVFDQLIVNNNSEMIESIKDAIGYDLDAAVIKTGNKVKGKEVLLFRSSVNVSGAKTQGVTIGALPSGLTSVGEILAIKIYKDGKFITDGVNNVRITNLKVDFNLGNGILYVGLPEPSYDVIVEFTAN
ncbi:calcium-binding protein [Myroides odoratus]|uniref:calcium-binding protein n=1 Tax=Myroides odoratus TaxID=256 RepID=UPI0033401A8B